MASEDLEYSRWVALNHFIIAIRLFCVFYWSLKPLYTLTAGKKITSIILRISDGISYDLRVNNDHFIFGELSLWMRNIQSEEQCDTQCKFLLSEWNQVARNTFNSSVIHLHAGMLKLFPVREILQRKWKTNGLRIFQLPYANRTAQNCKRRNISSYAKF